VNPAISLSTTPNQNGEDMIKNLATLAALSCLSVAASAQSVTIYGLVDLSMQHLRSGDAAPMAGGSLTRLADGTLYGPGSRLGFRVLEDLGGGLRAGAVMENGFFADSGTFAQGGRFLGRQVFVFVGGNFGELRMGRQYMLGSEVLPFTSPVGGVTVVNPGAPYTYTGGTMPLFIDPNRVDNALHYLTPVFGGFRLQAMVALDEKVNDRYQAVKASYANGPVNLGVAYEQSKALVVPPGGDSTVNKIIELGGNYDFGVVRLYAGYQQAKNMTRGIGTQVGTLTLPGLNGPVGEMKSVNVGASMPLGVATLVANYAQARYTSNASGRDTDVSRYGLGATYNLSKQTAVYGMVALAGGDLRDHVNEKQIYQLGLRKAF
jgi:GBP family porin